jgi:CubicO group peptidase (beta-lactamase class C family)
VGYADLEAKKPMQRDTLFWIASTTKTFQPPHS